MTPFHYKARILPDGHLPVPKDFPVQAGEEVEITLLAGGQANGAAQARERAEHLLKAWAGVGRGSGTGVAERHDEHLYGR